MATVSGSRWDRGREKARGRGETVGEGRGGRGRLIHARAGSGATGGRAGSDRVHGAGRRNRGRGRPREFYREPPGYFSFILLEPFSISFFCFINKTCSNLINWGSKWTPKFINLVCLESSSNFQPQHSAGFVLYKSCKCSFIQRQYNAYYVTNGISIILGSFTFPKFMNQAYIGSLRKVVDNPQPGVCIWKHFKCILKMGKEYDI